MEEGGQEHREVTLVQGRAAKTQQDQDEEGQEPDEDENEEDLEEEDLDEEEQNLDNEDGGVDVDVDRGGAHGEGRVMKRKWT